ncbi:hypothetical protein [Paraflavitalea speifideaquila]|uniref:hypothetical protein n=1 Tax=Paraflavitalea speifideaquila TaxID=3076558 RepID=UPI0028EE43D0|nr:hypothetical protein [Paraflavitalea speifideiaquila]
MQKPVLSFSFLVLLSGIMLQGCAQNTRNKADDDLPKNNTVRLPANMHIVQPFTPKKSNAMNKVYTSSQQNNQVEDLRIGMGQYFSYALPPGWRVGEDGQFALTLVSPDNKAFTVMVGNAGLMPGYPQPGLFMKNSCHYSPVDLPSVIRPPPTL